MAVDAIRRRIAAATAFWTDENAALEQAEAIALIARQIKFRPRSVQALPVDKRAKHLAGMAQVSDLLAARLLVIYHLESPAPDDGRASSTPWGSSTTRA